MRVRLLTAGMSIAEVAISTDERCQSGQNLGLFEHTFPRLIMYVSTIVPTRNRPLELKTALDAIARQTYREMEVIVVDDGSTPENAQVNKTLVDALGPQASYVFLPGHHPRGSGNAYVRNVGINAAKGDLVAFCDDDDYWCDDRHVESAVQAFSADPTLDLMFANQETYAKGQLVRRVWLPSLVDRLAPAHRSSHSSVRVSKRDCLIDDHGHLNTCVFRRDLLRQVGGCWEMVRYLVDLDLFVRAVDSARRIEFRPQTVSVHNIPDRTIKANASTQLDDRAKDIVQINVANHLLQCCRSIEARGFASRTAGYAYRHLAMDASKLRSDGTAFMFAKLALMWLPTLKWSAYTVLLGFKAMLAKSRAGS